jgi:putative colanic acid biosynthesis acetyltransferase WcaF
MRKVKLSKFDNSWYKPGRSSASRSIWYLINVLFLKTYLNPFSGLKVFILRLFGAGIGKGVVIKPGVNIKYPWYIVIGDNAWIGERVWIDSLAKVSIGSNCCISQGAYLCSGNHDYTKEGFDLIVKPIIIEDGVWIGAKAIICPGVTIRSHSVITAGSVVTHDTEPYTVYQGNPAKRIRERNIS